MRVIFIAFALAFLTVPAAAQDKKDAAPLSSTSVLINGQLLKGKVLDIDGKHFVAVEDLAQSLRGTISYGDGQIALTLSQPPSMPTQTPASQPTSIPSQTPSSQPSSTPAQPPSSEPTSMPPQPPSSQFPSTPPEAPSSQLPTMTPEQPETGRIKGTLTYLFSFHIGTKPDTGSIVWLVKGRVEIPANQNFVGNSTALGTSANPEQYTAIKYATTDENGNFEFLDIPPGQYTLIMQSAHTKWTLHEKNHLFGTGNSHNPRDSNVRVEFLDPLIKAGETFDASKDFGPNIDQ
jgi:hypothetical protein